MYEFTHAPRHDLGVGTLRTGTSPDSWIHGQDGAALSHRMRSLRWEIYVLYLKVRGRRAKILQASTSEAYGDPQVHPQPEEYWGHVNSIGPRACYDEGKRCAETLFFDYHRQHGLPIKVARIFNTYGPKMHPNDGRVISNFIIQALEGKPITIYGDGMQTRSFCYVDDQVEAIVRLMDSPPDFTGPVNIGNPIESSILELAKQIIELTASKSRLVFQPLPHDDPRQRCPDIGLAKKTLGWEPKVPLDKGLKQTIRYFDQLLSARQNHKN
ncbi:MAG: NAD-dependent epimerase/dehydratase family protein [Acidiferrobacterales bacterium]